MAGYRSTHLQHRAAARELARNATIAEQSPEAILAQQNFQYFCSYLTRNAPEPMHQPEHMMLWNKEIITGVDSKCLIKIAGPNVDLLSPRGSAKSTMMGMFAAWAIGIHTMAQIFLPILYVSYTVDIARPKSNSIKRIIESNEYREIFPMVLPGKKWSDELWSIDYDYAGISTLGRDVYSLCAAGLKGGITSKRSALVLLDDLIKSEADIKNLEVREEMSRNWLTCVRPTIFEGGRAICLGTRFRPDDIHVTTFVPSRGWVQIEQSALIEDEETGEEKSYWESMWSTDYLKGLRDGPDGDPVSFSYQYQNKVLRVSDTSIDPAWILKGECPENLLAYDALAIGLDLSSKEHERADFTVFTLGGRIGNKFYILDMKRGKWMGNIDKLDQLLELVTEWGFYDLDDSDPDHPRYMFNGVPVYLFGEDVAYQGSLQGDFNTYIVNQLKITDIIYRPAKTTAQVNGKIVGQDKLQRLRSVTGLFQNQLVTFNMYRPMGVAITELTSFGACSHDDAMDSVVYTLRGLRQLGRLEAA